MGNLEVTVFTSAAEPSTTMDRGQASENPKISEQIAASLEFGINK